MTNDLASVKSSEWATRSISLAKTEDFYPFSSYVEDLTLPATKIELATQLVLLYEKITGIQIEVSDSSLTDTRDINAIIAVELGFVEVGDDLEFCPLQTVNREDSFLSLCKLLNSLRQSSAITAPEYHFNDRDDFSNEETYSSACYLYGFKMLNGVYTIETMKLGDNENRLKFYENPKFNAFGRNMLPVDKLTKEQLLTLAVNIYSQKENMEMQSISNSGWGYVDDFNTSKNSPQQFLLQNWWAINRIAELSEEIGPILINEHGTPTIDIYQNHNFGITKSDAFAEIVSLMKSCNVIRAEVLPPFEDIDLASSYYLLTIAKTPNSEARLFWTPDGGYIYETHAKRLFVPENIEETYKGFWSFYIYNRQ